MSIDEFIKRPNKTLLAAATFWPLAYIFLLVAGALGLAFLLRDGEPSPAVSDALSVLFIGVVAVHMLTILGSLVLSVYYLIHIIKRPGVKDEIKALWAILFFFFGMFANPFYWYMYIRKEPAMAAITPEQLDAANTADWVRPDEPGRQGEYAPPGEMPDWR
jgi:hypothetical protein